MLFHLHVPWDIPIIFLLLISILNSIVVWEEIGLPRWLRGKESACQCRRSRFAPWIGKIPWRRKWWPTSVFFPGKSHEQRSPVGYSPWGCKKSDTTDQPNTHTHTHTIILSHVSIFSSVQSLSRVWLFATPWITACQASLSITNSRSSLKLMSIESMMPSDSKFYQIFFLNLLTWLPGFSSLFY